MIHSKRVIVKKSFNLNSYNHGNVYVEINGNEHIFGINSFVDTFEQLDEKRNNLINQILQTHEK